MATRTALLAITSAPASADYRCGTHTHADRTRTSGGYSVKVRIHYKNCGCRTARLRPDVANAWDPSCQTVYSGQNGYWSFSYKYYDDFDSGLPYFRKMYYC